MFKSRQALVQLMLFTQIVRTRATGTEMSDGQCPRIAFGPGCGVKNSG